ncbi:MAG: hypothetical protein JO048_08715 [Methylobacteriaceae bacterium]|nr:hypothetical protein [Methylobacteriaceae bacterium]
MALRISRGPAGLATEEDRLLDRGTRRAVSWGTVLVWFMRIMAAFWLAKGLGAWVTILGLAGGPFEDRASGYQAAMIYFAVIDLAAAVGLWLTSTWGGVLWLLAVMSHLILAVFFPRFVSNGAIIIAFFILAIMIYLMTSWLAAVEE